MRHRVAYRKLGRGHRASDLDAAEPGPGAAPLRAHRDDVPRAKELRPFVERIITIAKRGLAGARANRTASRATAGAARHPGSRVVTKLFDDIAPRFVERPGGYTRLLRLGYRRGDSAEVAQIELVGSEYDPNAEAEKTEEGREKAQAEGRRRQTPRPRPSGCAGRSRAGRRAAQPRASPGRPAGPREKKSDHQGPIRAARAGPRRRRERPAAMILPCRCAGTSS